MSHHGTTEKVQECVRAAGYIKKLLALDIKPRSVMG